MEIVLVYLGQNAMPQYVVENLKYLKEVFPNNLITLLSDNQANLNIAKKHSVNVYLCSDYMKNAPEKYLKEAPDLDFRNGFWFLTFSRFFALEEYLRHSSSRSILHVEADVLLMRNFPFRAFENLKGLAFPLVNKGYAAASTLFISDETSINKLCSLTKQMIFNNPKLTDMDVLGSSELLKVVEVTYLPSSFGKNEHYQEWVSELDRDLISSNISVFAGIFDGMTWGQFITGEDPRNHYGITKFYRAQSHHSVKINTYDLFFKDEYLFASCSCGTFPVYSLHIHSKDIEVFKSETSLRSLESRVLKIRPEAKNEYSWRLVLQYLPLRIKNYLRTQIRKIVSLRGNTL